MLQVAILSNDCKDTDRGKKRGTECVCHVNQRDGHVLAGGYVRFQATGTVSEKLVTFGPIRSRETHGDTDGDETSARCVHKLELRSISEALRYVETLIGRVECGCSTGYEQEGGGLREQLPGSVGDQLEKSCYLQPRLAENGASFLDDA